MFAASPDKLTFQSPELWVYLLGLSTLLGIALRRVKKQQQPLTNELYAKTVAIEHVQSGIAWITSDGIVRSINQAFATSLGFLQRELVGRAWYDLFASSERTRLEEAHSQMLIAGKTSLVARGAHSGGTTADLEVLLVAVHDHKMTFVGHHCMVLDRTRELQFERELGNLQNGVAGSESAETPDAQPAVSQKA